MPFDKSRKVLLHASFSLANSSMPTQCSMPLHTAHNKIMTISPRLGSWLLISRCGLWRSVAVRRLLGSSEGISLRLILANSFSQSFPTSATWRLSYESPWNILIHAITSLLFLGIPESSFWLHCTPIFDKKWLSSIMNAVWSAHQNLLPLSSKLSQHHNCHALRLSAIRKP